MSGQSDDCASREPEGGDTDCSENKAPAAPAAGAVEVPLTMAERLALKAEMEENCRSLTALLQKYTADEQALKEVVMEFIVRDVEEQNAAAAICATVAQHQSERLSDPAYVRWAMQRKRGEFAEDFNDRNRAAEEIDAAVAAKGVAAIEAVASLHGGNFKRDGGDLTSDAPGSWLEKLPVLACSASASGTASKSHRPLAASGVALSNFGDAASILSSWKRRTEAGEATLERLRTALTALLPDTPEGAVLFLNGAPLLSAAATLVSDQSFVNALAAASSPSPTPEHLFAKWWSAITSRCATRNGAELRDVFAANQDLIATAMRHDEGDVICVVPAERVANSVTVRAIVIRGVVRAVEVLSPNLDALRAIGGFVVADDPLLLQAVDQTVTAALSLLKDVSEEPENQRRPPKSHAVVLLVPTMATLHSGTAAPLIVDIQELSPQLPFDWQLSWSDICTMAQTTPPTAGMSVPLKAMRKAVVQLEPVDAVTAAWFPVLNSMHCMSRHIDPAERAPTAAVAAADRVPASSSAPPSSSSPRGAASSAMHPAVVATVAAAAAVAVTLWATRGRK